VDLGAYKRELIQRFANPVIGDTVERVNHDAPVNYLLDPIRDRLHDGSSVDLLALALAAWIRRASGRDDLGAAIANRHPIAKLLHERALAGGPDPRPVLKIKQIFGELGEDDRLVLPVAAWLGRLWQGGAADCLRRAASTGRF
jgi:mannitol-1-phosphate/altronate dehydrogenase